MTDGQNSYINSIALLTHDKNVMAELSY